MVATICYIRDNNFLLRKFISKPKEEILNKNFKTIIYSVLKRIIFTDNKINEIIQSLPPIDFDSLVKKIA